MRRSAAWERICQICEISKTQNHKMSNTFPPLQNKRVLDFHQSTYVNQCVANAKCVANFARRIILKVATSFFPNGVSRRHSPLAWRPLLRALQADLSQILVDLLLQLTASADGELHRENFERKRQILIISCAWKLTTSSFKVIIFQCKMREA